MKFELFSRVAIAEDLPEHNLKRGDIVTIVEVLPANALHLSGYIVEVFSVTGETLDVVGLLETQLMPLRADAVPAMRELAVAA
ncbi:MAG: DUF4926 domain-containing protein [Saprospiraceae bacterium]|nr:DUF4926 domain-containing protein [Saprospiraceae bacterium]